MKTKNELRKWLQHLLRLMSPFAPTGSLLSFYSFDVLWICCCQTCAKRCTTTNNWIGVWIRRLWRKPNRTTTENSKFDFGETTQWESWCSAFLCDWEVLLLGCVIPAVHHMGQPLAWVYLAAGCLPFLIQCVIKNLKSCSENGDDTILPSPPANLSSSPNWFFGSFLITPLPCQVYAYIYLD